ncbi:MAG: Predicted hydrolases or acyltransferases (alpha/beta hydrolase superfamily), partial [uncultured Microvirga sp.]
GSFAGTPLSPRLLARSASDRASVERLIRNTGSTLEPEGVALYERLMRDPDHIAGALAMMANWDLRPLERDLPTLRPALLLVVGGADRAIPPEDAFRVRERVPAARVRTLRGLGHLAHEERPDEIAEVIESFACSVGALPD